MDVEWEAAARSNMARENVFEMGKINGMNCMAIWHGVVGIQPPSWYVRGADFHNYDAWVRCDEVTTKEEARAMAIVKYRMGG